MSDQAIVLFPDSGVDLASARVALGATSLTVRGDNRELQISWHGGPVLRVTFERGPDVLAEARELGEGTPYAELLTRCNARFVITADDLDAVLDDTNTLIETQLTLQHATQGVLFNTWNDELSGPEPVR
jgi:hypothetical protein